MDREGGNHPDPGGPDQDRLAALHDENRFLRSLMEHFPDRIYFKDLQSRFTCGNQAFARLFNLFLPLDERAGTGGGRHG